MLELAHVAKSFREPDGGLLPILSIREFRVRPAEQVVLMGRSGSGKTTFLHIIAGIVRPDRGSVRIDNHEITKLSESARDLFRAAHIGYVFQTFNLLPGFSALVGVARFSGLVGREAELAIRLEAPFFRLAVPSAAFAADAPPLVSIIDLSVAGLTDHPFYRESPFCPGGPPE